MNKLEELLKLKELLELGIITDTDFNRKKAELFSNSNTGNNYSDSKKNEEITVSENEKKCPSCKFINDKKCEICKFCNYDFINKNNTKNNADKIDNNILKKTALIFSGIIIFIFLGNYFFIEKKSNINSEIELKAKQNKNELVKKDIDKASRSNIKDNSELNNKSLCQKIRDDFNTEKKLFFIEKNNKEIAYEITLKKDTIVLGLNYKLAPGEESKWGNPDSDGYYSRYDNICILKNGEIFDFYSNGILEDFKFINNKLYVGNEEYVLKPSKSNCKVIDILIPVKN